MIHFACACGWQLQADESRIGAPVRCPVCNEMQTVPAPAASLRRPWMAARSVAAAVAVAAYALALAGLLLRPQERGLSPAGGRVLSANNLRDMGLALSDYARLSDAGFPPIGGGRIMLFMDGPFPMNTTDDRILGFDNRGVASKKYGRYNGELPPPERCVDAIGAGLPIHPNLSWRVAILPFLKKRALYEQFHFNEPWDSPHNLTLLPQMPETYALPDASDPPGMTRYRAIAGKCAAFEAFAPGAPRPAGRRAGDFPKGVDQTAFIAEAAEAVPWTKPAELDYAPYLPLPHLRDDCQCVMGNGAVRTIEAWTSEAEVRALLDRAAP